MNKTIIHVIGPTYIDYSIYLKDEICLDGTSRIRSMTKSPGGTGLCYSLALTRLGGRVKLHTIIGKDDDGKNIKTYMKRNNIQSNLQHEEKYSTDYAYILTGKGNHKVAASSKVVSKKWTVDNKFRREISNAEAVIITSFPNLIVKKVLSAIKQNCVEKPFIMWAPHLQNCINAEFLDGAIEQVDHISLTENEYRELEKSVKNIYKYVKSVTVTSGINGCRLIGQGLTKRYKVYQKVEKPLDTNGAGEAFGAGFISSYLFNNDFEKSVKAGSYYAYLHLFKKSSNFPKINIDKILEEVEHQKINRRKKIKQLFKFI